MKHDAVLILAALASTSFAHQLDEYIQAATFSIEKNRLSATMRLIPGEKVCRQVLRLIDTDRDQSISPIEQHAYALRLLRDVSITIDGKHVHPRLGRTSFPALKLMQEGIGEIRLTFSTALRLSPGTHRFAFVNRHQPRIAAYMANCLMPDDPSIKVTTQGRSHDQSRYEVRFALGIYRRKAM